MPRMIRVSLTSQQRAQLEQHLRQRVLDPRLRDRLEMVRLSALGWSVPWIADSREVHQQTVRHWLNAFLAQGFSGLVDRPRSGRPPTVTTEDLDAVVARLTADAAGQRTWTAPQLCAWLAEQRGVHITPAHLSDLLRQRKLRWKRTYRSVRHKQKDPVLQAQKRTDLETLIFDRGRSAGQHRPLLFR